ncbi:MAG: aminopeptidase P family protein [Candidatus Symbiobacter sp.]|nr:aminopeptidase P family protein [Candidatus Symbiobacter sp.]
MTSQAPNHDDKLTLLRKILAERGLDGMIILHNDMYQNEYLPPAAQQLAFLTGFTGSAGVAVVLPERAAVFSDGRYTLQMAEQVDQKRFECLSYPVNTEDYLTKYWRELTQKSRTPRIGLDAMQASLSLRDLYSNILTKLGGELVDLYENPIHSIWPGRPAAPAAQIVAHGLDYAGVATRDKIAQIAQAVTTEGADTCLLTTPESIMWLLNVRGGDIDYNPVALSLAVLHCGKNGLPALLDWFVEADRLDATARDSLPSAIKLHDTGPYGTETAKIQAFKTHLAQLAATGIKLLVEKETAASGLVLPLETSLDASGGKIIYGRDPITAAKAIKNPTEMAGAQAAHKQDGMAMCQYLAWLAGCAERNELPDEVAAADYLKNLRLQRNLCVGESFATISGAAHHAAVVHYHATPDSAIKLSKGEIYLVDSGGQYLNATTDVTRTILIGQKSEADGDKLAAMQECFTRVLKGHIALATARFPQGTSGVHLDGLARAALWQVGLDYIHGTGHGVGSYLAVHEGPHSISTPYPQRKASAALEPGMLVTNEPGYYRKGAFGIRIESMLLVRRDAKPKDEHEMLAFDTLTLVPIDHQLIDLELLTATEIAWIDAYHRRVYAQIAPELNPSEQTWLAAATRPLTETKAETDHGKKSQ